MTRPGSVQCRVSPGHSAANSIAKSDIAGLRTCTLGHSVRRNAAVLRWGGRGGRGGRGGGCRGGRGRGRRRRERDKTTEKDEDREGGGGGEGVG
eukprot:1472116-Rhodomonas_salina.2